MPHPPPYVQKALKSSFYSIEPTTRSRCAIDKAYAKVLQRKLDVFQAQTETRKILQLVLITLRGFKPNIWSEDLIDVALDATEIFGDLQV